MKGLNKDDILRRFEKSSVKPKVECIKISRPISSGSMVYTNAIRIVIPGKPIADSRPRYTSNGGHFYNSHKTNLMKIFEHIYDNSALENICIMSPMKIEIKVYKPIPKIHDKALDVHSKNLLSKELLHDIGRPDNDNYEKVHYDVLQDDKYMIILMDEAIVDNNTKKYYVKDEKLARVEITIFYSDKLDKWYQDKVMRETQYLKYTISPKYMKKNKIDKKDWKKEFYKNIIKFKKDNKKTEVTKAINKVLSLYNTKDLYLLGEGKNRLDAENNIMKTVITTIERMTKK